MHGFSYADVRAVAEIGDNVKRLKTVLCSCIVDHYGNLLCELLEVLLSYLLMIVIAYGGGQECQWGYAANDRERKGDSIGLFECCVMYHSAHLLLMLDIPAVSNIYSIIAVFYFKGGMA